MSIYIPMTRATRVPVGDFQKAAPHGDPEVFGAECPNRKGLSGSKTKISGLGNSSESLLTCRAVVDGKMVLCDACNAQYQHAKEAMGEGVSVYLAENEEQVEETKPLKERIIQWVKAHPILAIAVGVGAGVAFVSIIAGLSSYASAAGTTDTMKGSGSNATTDSNLTDSNATVVPTVKDETKPVPTDRPAQPTKPTEKAPTQSTKSTTTKTAKPTTKPKTTQPPAQPPKPTTKATTAQTSNPTTKPATTQEPKKGLKLELEIFNSQNKQDLSIQTMQRFNDRPSVRKNCTVPRLNKTQLIFDINKDHHRDVTIFYTNRFQPPLRDYKNAATVVPTSYTFGKSFAETDSKGEFVHDRNHDGILAASHTIFADNEYYFINREIEGTDGKATPSVTTRDVKLVIKNEVPAPFSCHLYEQRGGKQFVGKVSIQSGTSSETRIDVGTNRLEISCRPTRMTSSPNKQNKVYTAKYFPIDANGYMCVRTSPSPPYYQKSLESGKCE